MTVISVIGSSRLARSQSLLRLAITATNPGTSQVPRPPRSANKNADGNTTPGQPYISTSDASSATNSVPRASSLMGRVA
ncbi:hypothetical protein D3C77_538320 [compost metagenome]